MNKISEHIKNWLINYANSSKQKGFVVGVSGGIDSAVVSTLCAETGLPTIVVSLPIKEKVGHNLSLEHIKNLCDKYPNVKSTNVDLTKTFEAFCYTIETKYIITSENEEVNNLALANVRSRLRMLTLYNIAQCNSMLVVGTGNKVEDFGIGFYTKYGDGGVDISPIADLMKSEVYELGRYLGVTENILKARPTDGLWTDGRTDEDQIGATYDELEWAMNFLDTGIVDYEKAPDVDRQKIVLDIYTKRNMVNRHKMNPIPVCSLKKFRNYLNKLEMV
jgi:NAD+ synthase